MQTRRLLALVLVSLTFLTACGNGGSSHVSPSTPVFTSVPGTAATQDVVYTYQLAVVDPTGGSVTFFSDRVSHGRDAQRRHRHLDSNRRAVAGVEPVHGDGDHGIRRHGPAILERHARRHDHRQLGQQLLDSDWPSAGPGIVIGESEYFRVRD